MTGILLGYAIPDRYCDRELILNVYNRANEKAAGSRETDIAELLATSISELRP
jgi:hypothetical protein